MKGVQGNDMERDLSMGPSLERMRLYIDMARDHWVDDGNIDGAIYNLIRCLNELVRQLEIQQEEKNRGTE